MWYVSQDTFWNPMPSGPNGNWMDFSIDLQAQTYHVVNTMAPLPGTMPQLALAGAPTSGLPPDAKIVSFGFVWPNSGNVDSQGNTNPTMKANTVRWDDVVLSSV